MLLNGASPMKPNKGFLLTNKGIFAYMQINAFIFRAVLASKNDNNSFISLWYNISLVLQTQIRVQSFHKKTTKLWLLVRTLALHRFTTGLL